MGFLSNWVPGGVGQKRSEISVVVTLSHQGEEEGAERTGLM